ncbi:small GTPase Cdc42 [Mycena olivaceomarginata]|nr:small GTPase Cdc42 [Mycena olivaceomarginata]
MIVSIQPTYSRVTMFPFVYDAPHTTVKLKEETHELALWDTAGLMTMTRLRPLSYPQNGLTWPISFENIRDKWYPEMRHYCPDVPFLIVATQIDLRDDSEATRKVGRTTKRLVSVSTEEGERLAYELGAAKYVECSAVTQKGLKNVFDEAASAALKPPPIKKKPKRTCIIL